MTYRILPVLVGLCAALMAANAASAQVFPYEVQRAGLDNGLKVLMVPMPSEGLVAYWSLVRTGSRDEVEQGVTGFAHFFEHMMFRGSEKYPGSVYDSIVTSMGADANAYTTDDYTAYHLSFSSEDLATVVEIEADRFQNLRYSEADFKTEAGAVFGEYRKGRTNPFFALMEGTHQAAFDKHTYRHMTIGYEDDIRKMPQQFEYSKSFFQRYYRPENVVLFIAGDFEPARAMELIRQNYSGWQPGYVKPAIPVEPEQSAARRAVFAFDGQTLPILALNFKGQEFRPQDRKMMAATLIGELAFGETSALYRKLVLDEQRVDVLFDDFGFNRDPGLWSVYARVKDPDDVAAVESEIWLAIDSLRQRTVAAERLNAVRSRLKYSFLSGLTTPSAVASNLARLIAVSGDLHCIEQMYSTLDQVTPGDVQAAALTYLEEQRCTVSVLHTAGSPLPDRPTTAAGEEVLWPVPQDPNVAFHLWFKVGSQNDPPGKEGLAALTAAMLTEAGTLQHSYDQVLEQLFPMAGSYQSSVDKEMTIVRGQVHRDHAGEFYALFASAVLQPGFRQEDFDRLRDQAILTLENTLRFSSDEELGKAALFESVYKDTPYAHLTLGTVAGLRALTLEDARRFYKEHYGRENVVLGLGGAYSPALLSRLRADLQRLPTSSADAVPAPEVAPINGRQVLLVEKDGPSTAISFGHPIDVHRGSREFYALWLANSWLGEHRNSASHLYQVIRETRGMNYGDYSYIEVFPNGGRRNFPPTGVGRRQQLFEVWIRPVPRSQAIFALRAALREVDHLIQHGLTPEQFETTRNFLLKYYLHYAETTADRLGYAVDDQFYGIDEGHLQRFREVLPTLTLEEVNAAVRKHLQLENLLIAMVTAQAEDLRSNLISSEPSPMDYGDVEKPAEILQEDQEIERWPLAILPEHVRVIPVEEMFAGTSG
jgi:zinc protease